jgi:CheY-like chemotaxis protein/anti-sigma regulatory factor (Ser/Thr protein kinase)
VLALERAARMKDAFLSQMSHELRTPLNAVLGFTHLQLADALTPLSAANRQRAEQVQLAGQHLLSLIEDALDIASIEAGRIAVTLEPVDVAATVADCLAMLEPQARALGLHLSGPAGAPAPGRVLADARRLRQVLLNLISNAVKYNRPGGEVRVDCRAEAQPGRVTIVVADTGAGIGAPLKERLFRPFDRLGAERTDVEGAGLGLVITRLLVQAMDGTLEIDSEVGRGTVASVSLPAAPTVAEPEPMNQSAPAAPARLLYIEGDRASRTLMGGVVAGIEGASLVVAPDGLSGLAQARQWRPAVVIVDLNLPDIDGISVLRALRQSPDTRDCYCVAVSTDATDSAATSTRSAGFDEFWPKPSGLEFMRQRLAELLHGN